MTKIFYHGVGIDHCAVIILLRNGLTIPYHATSHLIIFFYMYFVQTAASHETTPELKTQGSKSKTNSEALRLQMRTTKMEQGFVITSSCGSQVT